jgi:hypothetical protein
MAAYARRVVRFVDGASPTDERQQPVARPRPGPGMMASTPCCWRCAIRRNLMRSVLTILGIVIGVAAVITMVTVGNGATRAVQTRSPAWAATC